MIFTHYSLPYSVILLFMWTAVVEFPVTSLPANVSNEGLHDQESDLYTSGKGNLKHLNSKVKSCGQTPLRSHSASVIHTSFLGSG